MITKLCIRSTERRYEHEHSMMSRDVVLREGTDYYGENNPFPRLSLRNFGGTPRRNLPELLYWELIYWKDTGMGQINYCPKAWVIV